MTALELDGQDAHERGVTIQRRLRNQGIIVDFHCLGASFRFFPPYVITRPQLDLALNALDSAPIEEPAAS